MPDLLGLLWRQQTCMFEEVNHADIVCVCPCVRVSAEVIEMLRVNLFKKL